MTPAGIRFATQPSNCLAHFNDEPLDDVGANSRSHTTEMDMIDELQAANRCEMFVEQLLDGTPRARALNPVGRGTAGREADHLAGLEQRHISATSHGVAKPHTEDAIDVTLHHGRLGIHPKRIDKSKNVRRGEQLPLSHNVRSRRKSARLWYVARIEDR